MVEHIIVPHARVAPQGPSEVLARILDDLRRSAASILGAAVADRNGLPIASGFGRQVNLLTITAMSAMAVQSCNSILQNLDLRPLRIVVMEGEGSLVLVRVLSEGLSLLTIISRDANLGLVRLEVERAAHRIQEALGL